MVSYERIKYEGSYLGAVSAIGIIIFRVLSVILIPPILILLIVLRLRSSV